MSHSTVLVCLRPGTTLTAVGYGFADVVNDALTAVLAPFDENVDAEPYREYEEGDPADNWVYTSCKASAEHVQNGTGILPYKPDGFGWSSAESKRTPEAQQRELEEEAALYYVAPEPVTWAYIVELHKARWPEESSSVPLLDEDGRAYTMSTYPQEKLNDKGALVGGPRWDWWLLGGRWTGYFTLKPQDVASQDIAIGRPGTLTEPNRDHSKTDAAVKRSIDIAGMRKEAVDDAATQWWAFRKIRERYPETKPWSHYHGLVEAETITIDEARELYREQPGRQALRDTEFGNWFGDDPYDVLGGDLEAYQAKQEQRAVPGWAMLTLDGEWWERGTMGWFGFSSQTEESEDEFLKASNAYIDGLPDDTILAIVDVHI